ncbi:hypothetical protein ACLOJK_020069 [Asimina triloba]
MAVLVLRLRIFLGTPVFNSQKWFHGQTKEILKSLLENERPTFWISGLRLMADSTLQCSFMEARRQSVLIGCQNCFRMRANVGTAEKSTPERILIDKRGRLRSINPKKLSRKKGLIQMMASNPKRAVPDTSIVVVYKALEGAENGDCLATELQYHGGSLRGRGWKYGSGFVDGIFPVLGPMAQELLKYLQKEKDVDKIWQSLDTLSVTHSTWDDLINVSVQLRLNKQWDPIVSVCEWILYKSSFKLDIMCYNLLIDAYGQKFQHNKAESVYLKLLETYCIPTEDTYALLLRAYCLCGLLDKAEAICAEMRRHGVHPSEVVYNAYIDGLMKGGNTQRAVEVFQKMKGDGCQPSADTYTMLINLYGKASQSFMALKLFNEMKTVRCKANICTYTALINAFAREGLCEKAEEIFEELQGAGLEPDVYAYNALMEAYSAMSAGCDSVLKVYSCNSRAGYPYGSAEIFSLMQHMGCEPDTASYNIMVDAYGRAGLHKDAESMFKELKRKGLTPTMKSHMLLLSAYSKNRNVEKCEEIVNQMRKTGLEPDTFVLNTMINMHGHMGHFEKMEDVLSTMEDGPCKADISTYNILINLYGRAGFCDRMEDLFQSLPTKNLKPDVVTWTSRMSAYSRKKQYQKCMEIFEEMVDAGCYPDGGAARVLLSACSNDSQIEQVTTVIRSMHKETKTVLDV